jgi:hypothetical protein
MSDEKPMNAAGLQAAARRMSELALKTLTEIMEGKGQDSVKLAAAREVLDRGHGKPKPAVKAKARTPKTPAQGAVTVVIKRFTDAPDPEAGEYEERP